MDNTNFYDFIMYFLLPFEEHMTDTQFSIMVSSVCSGVLMLFISGLVSAVWGCFGALTALRRSKRG